MKSPSLLLLLLLVVVVECTRPLRGLGTTPPLRSPSLPPLLLLLLLLLAMAATVTMRTEAAAPPSPPPVAATSRVVGSMLRAAVGVCRDSVNWPTS